MGGSVKNVCLLTLVVFFSFLQTVQVSSSQKKAQVPNIVTTTGTDMLICYNL